MIWNPISMNEEIKMCVRQFDYCIFFWSNVSTSIPFIILFRIDEWTMDVRRNVFWEWAKFRTCNIHRKRQQLSLLFPCASFSVIHASDDRSISDFCKRKSAIEIMLFVIHHSVDSISRFIVWDVRDVNFNSFYNVYIH